MVLAAIALDHEPSVDDHVDPAHPHHDHLDVNVSPESPGHEPNQGLRARLRAMIDVGMEPTHALRERAEQLIKLALADEAEMQRRVKGCDGSTWLLAQNRLPDGVDRLHHQRARMWSAQQVTPVPHNIVTRRANLPVSRKVSVRDGTHLDEDVRNRQGRDAVQATSRACRRTYRRGDRPVDVDIAPNAHERTRGYGRGDLATGEAGFM